MSRKELFWISVTVFMTILAWMLIDIYKVETTPSTVSSLGNIVQINFTINPKILGELKKKQP